MFTPLNWSTDVSLHVVLMCKWAFKFAPLRCKRQQLWSSSDREGSWILIIPLKIYRNTLNIQLHRIHRCTKCWQFLLLYDSQIITCVAYCRRLNAPLSDLHDPSSQHWHCSVPLWHNTVQDMKHKATLKMSCSSFWFFPHEALMTHDFWRKSLFIFPCRG